MDAEKFDRWVTALASDASRRRLLKGVAGAVGAVVGLDRATADARRHRRVRAAAARCRDLGESCQSDASCCGPQSTTHLFCDQVGDTGAHRCECTTGFIACGGQCVSSTCPGGKVLVNCVCQCPSGQVECNGICRTPCPAGQTFDADCNCVCPTGNVFCNGCCFDPVTACANLHNKNFNAECCSCENPGQPSGRCKNPPLTCTS